MGKKRARRDIPPFDNRFGIPASTPIRPLTNLSRSHFGFELSRATSATHVRPTIAGRITHGVLRTLGFVEGGGTGLRPSASFFATAALVVVAAVATPRS